MARRKRVEVLGEPRKWFRMWHGFWSNPKMATFSPAEKYTLITMYYLASESNHAGMIDYDLEDVAAMCHVPVTQMSALMERFCTKRVLEVDETGTRYMVPNWSKWQSVDEQAAERARTYRERNRHGRVTHPSRTQRDTVTPEAEAYTDTDTLSIRIESVGSAPALDDVVNVFRRDGFDATVAQSFHDHYTAQGWMSGNGQRIVNWQAKAKRWMVEEAQRRRKEQNTNSQRKQQRGLQQLGDNAEAIRRSIDAVQRGGLALPTATAHIGSTQHRDPAGEGSLLRDGDTGTG